MTERDWERPGLRLGTFPLGLGKPIIVTPEGSTYRERRARWAGNDHFVYSVLCTMSRIQSIQSIEVMHHSLLANYEPIYHHWKNWSREHSLKHCLHITRNHRLHAVLCMEFVLMNAVELYRVLRRQCYYWINLETLSRGSVPVSCDDLERS